MCSWDDQKFVDVCRVQLVVRESGTYKILYSISDVSSIPPIVLGLKWQKFHVINLSEWNWDGTCCQVSCFNSSKTVSSTIQWRLFLNHRLRDS